MQFFITRPVFAMVLSVLITLAGVLALTQLPIAQYPEVVPPQVVVTAVYPGADARTLSETVAAPIEQQVNGVEGMLYMESQATNDGAMRLTITFRQGTDPDMAQVLVQNRVNVALPQLPEEVRRLGVVTKKQSTAILLVVNLVSTKEARTDDEVFQQQLAVSRHANNAVKDELARLNGVGDVAMFGNRDYAMRVWLDPDKMTDVNLVPSEVVDAIRKQNVQVAAGQIGQPPVPKGQARQLVVNTLGRLKTEAQFKDIVVKSGEAGEALVRLGDVARVELGAKSYDSSSALDNKPSVGLPVFQLPGGNAFNTARDVKAKMKALRASADWPDGIDYQIVYDPTEFVEESVREVVKTLFEAILLVFVVVLLFLQNWRAALIPMIAVPVSLVGTLAVMFVLGYSINNLTLFGMVLAIGIVVDDAIVVVEAVEFHIARGLAPLDATRKAMSEVSMAIVGVSLVLCAVFIPAAVIPGLTGQFFKQFAVTIAVSTLISAFNSLTLSPALCPILLRDHHAGKDLIDKALHYLFGWWLFRGFNWTFDRGTKLYGTAVSWLIRLTVVVLLVYAGLLAVAGRGFSMVPGGFIPQQDQGYLVVNLELPPAAAVERTDEVMKQVAAACLSTDGVAHTVEISGYSIFSSANIPNNGGIYVCLKPFGERKGRGAEAITNELNAKFAQIRGGTATAFGAPPILGLGNAGGFKMQIQDRGNIGSETLEGMTWSLATEASRDPRAGIPVAFSSFRSNNPQVFLTVDRDRVQQMGVSVSAVNDALQSYMGQVYVNDITLENRNWQVTVQADGPFRRSIDDLAKIKVRGANGEMIPIAGLLNTAPYQGPSKVNRYQMYPSADLNGITIPTLISSGQAMEKMEALAKRDLPPGLKFEWTEMAYQQKEASNTRVEIPGVYEFRGDTTLLVFGLSVVIAFLVLAALYESWLLPLAIVLIVPMCLLCAVIGLIVTHLDLNVFSQIGLVVLVGLATKNAILIVEYAKQKREAGMPRFEAAVEAATQRLRPILMTSFAFILGVVPLLIGEGAGSEMRKALGTVVFSGMLGVTVFGIFFTPVFYAVIERFRGEPHPAAPAAPEGHANH
ncbi:Efflux pump membrane transporter BepE [Gemmata obscuriglobus]|uniref:Multidrug efflux RND transporter permease subunit n=1 Tax=Gemmata obscuriglobus TaxID=114 RepID=A0A2Z3HGZ0_9BACT|nr:multidrug efflux RND transporter permease subunit [Gemmata obscuriglobus]QEG29202.1 Efflux pump membrane transporter BepE [Gemmata obscuriglobus]VTS07981.1 transporter : Efflux pump membrane transporter BepE OS=Methyloglobulus morosus KoM1 GN=bepE PE=4 SV=1: ACR_tran [Gemmata obscuriglobus UQM 2246]